MQKKPGGFPKLGDYSILGSILGSPYFGKLPPKPVEVEARVGEPAGIGFCKSGCAPESFQHQRNPSLRQSKP